MAETAGKLLKAHHDKNIQLEDDVREYTRQMSPDIAKNIMTCLFRHLKSEAYQNKDFYILICTVKDPALKEYRHLYVARFSCPTPDFRQVVFKYHHEIQSLEYLWALPDKIEHYKMLNPENLKHKDANVRAMSKLCHLKESGELLNWVKKQNKEHFDYRDNFYLKVNKSEEKPC